MPGWIKTEGQQMWEREKEAAKRYREVPAPPCKLCGYEGERDRHPGTCSNAYLQRLFAR